MRISQPYQTSYQRRSVLSFTLGGLVLLYGVPIPALIGPSQLCARNVFHHDTFGDHFQTCKVKSVTSLTHPHYGRSHVHPIGQLTNIRRSDGSPEPDGSLRVEVRKKIDDFLRLLFLHVHREVSALANDLPEESSHFRFLRDACLANIKWSVGLFLAKASAMRISIPLDLSSRTFIPLPHFILSR